MNKLYGFLIALILMISPALAEERHIHVNGEHLEAEDIALMDQLFGTTVPNGFYWLNPQTGEWGYEDNNQVQGVIAAIAQHQQQEQQTNQGSSNQTVINSSQNGSVVSGNIGGQNCTYASAGGTTVRLCD